MNPQQQPSNPSSPPPQYEPEMANRQRVSNELSVMQKGEVVVCKMKRHPIGIIAIYTGMGIVIVILALLAFGSSSLFGSNGGDQVSAIVSVIFLFLTAVFIVYGLIATKVYWGNSWVVTSDSITQITQSSLFNRQSSQLALSNIEDVTAEQSGIFTHIFNYGTIKAETAGHHSKFVFNYCPNPNFYAQKILEAHEALGGGGHHGVSPLPNQNQSPQSTPNQDSNTTG